MTTARPSDHYGAIIENPTPKILDLPKILSIRLIFISIVCRRIKPNLAITLLLVKSKLGCRYIQYREHYKYDTDYPHQQQDTEKNPPEWENHDTCAL